MEKDMQTNIRSDILAKTTMNTYMWFTAELQWSKMGKMVFIGLYFVMA